MSVLVDLDSEGGVISRGVAYLPVDLSNVAWHQERSLMRCDVEVVLIEISAIEVNAHNTLFSGGQLLYMGLF